MNAIGYTRLSAKDQSKYSLDDQKASITDYCLKNGLELAALFSDNGQCSDTFDRADFLALEAFIKKHKGKVRYLLVMAHDRFSRDISEALSKIKEFERKYGITVLSVDEPITLDPDDPEVFILRAFKYLMANQELLSIRKRTRRGIRNAMEAGRFVNRAPFGYKNDRDESDKSVLSVEEGKASIVQHIFKQYLKGEALFQIHAEAKKLGFTKCGNSAIPRVLSNCLYAGLIKLPKTKKQPERYVKALHPPIVSEPDFWRVQQMLENKKPSKTQPKEDFPLRGILKCGCGQNMTAGWSKGRNKHYVYYNCIKHRGICVSGIKLHEQFNAILHHLSLSTEQVNYIQKNVASMLTEALNDRVKQIGEKTKTLHELDIKIEKLEDRLMNDEIEPDTYKKWFKKYNGERGEIMSELSILNSDKTDQWDRLNKHLPLLTNIPGLYEKANLEQQHMLLKRVFEHGLIYSDGVVRTTKLNAALAHNTLTLKEKGLLYVEQPNDVRDLTPVCSP